MNDVEKAFTRYKLLLEGICKRQIIFDEQGRRYL